MEKQPKTWEELLTAGYVVELTEEQVASFKDRTGVQPRPFSYADNDHIKAGQEAEEKMRQRHNKGGK